MIDIQLEKVDGGYLVRAWADYPLIEGVDFMSTRHECFIDESELVAFKPNRNTILYIAAQKLGLNIDHFRETSVALNGAHHRWEVEIWTCDPLPQPEFMCVGGPRDRTCSAMPGLDYVLTEIVGAEFYRYRPMTVESALNHLLRTHVCQART